MGERRMTVGMPEIHGHDVYTMPAHTRDTANGGFTTYTIVGGSNLDALRFAQAPGYNPDFTRILDGGRVAVVQRDSAAGPQGFVAPVLMIPILAGGPTIVIVRCFTTRTKQLPRGIWIDHAITINATNPWPNFDPLNSSVMSDGNPAFSLNWG